MKQQEKKTSVYIIKLCKLMQNMRQFMDKRRKERKYG